MDDTARKAFWETLCSLNGTDIDADSIKLQKAIKYPQYIYRYRDVNFRTLEALQENKLYFSSADRYDDPFDTFLHIDWYKVKNKIGALDLKQVVEEKIIPFLRVTTGKQFDGNELFQHLSHNKILETTVEFLNECIRPELQKRSYSICFSESGVNENLWLKYAEHHRGFCLVYDLAKEENLRCGKEKECYNCIMKEKINFLYPVYYSTEKYDATEYAINCAIERILRETIKNDQLWKQFVAANPMFWEREKSSLIKHNCHRYDQEWRILLGVTPKDALYLKWIPDAVILGLRIDNLNAKMVVRSAKMAGIDKILQTAINPNDDLVLQEVPEETLNNLLKV